MPARGKFIVLEGIDGSGKGTQLEMLARAFAARGIASTQVSFPRYDGFFGKLVARFLNGEFGPLDAVDPHFSALLYAGDRLGVTPALENDLAADAPPGRPLHRLKSRAPGCPGTARNAPKNSSDGSSNSNIKSTRCRWKIWLFTFACRLQRLSASWAKKRDATTPSSSVICRNRIWRI